MKEGWLETYSWVTFCAAAQPPEKTTKMNVLSRKTVLRPYMSLNLENMTITADRRSDKLSISESVSSILAYVAQLVTGHDPAPFLEAADISSDGDQGRCGYSRLNRHKK